MNYLSNLSWNFRDSVDKVKIIDYEDSPELDNVMDSIFSKDDFLLEVAIHRDSESHFNISFEGISSLISSGASPSPSPATRRVYPVCRPRKLASPRGSSIPGSPAGRAPPPASGTPRTACARAGSRCTPRTRRGTPSPRPLPARVPGQLP